MEQPILRVVCISDTHLKHNDIIIPSGDILIHCGDFLNFSRNFARTATEFEEFIEFMRIQPHKYKFLIGGNHDLLIDTANPDVKIYIKQIKDAGIIYLNDESYVISNGIAKGYKIYGSPSTGMSGFAFSDSINSELIPLDTDILITHVPPYKILDKAGKGSTAKNVGDKNLRKKVKQIKPSIHVFGHIHESYGYIKAKYSESTKKTIFVNCSIQSNKNELNEPYIIEIPIKSK